MGQKHGWYSPKVADQQGAQVWRQASGRQVVVTTLRDKNDTSFPEDDATYIGPVIDYVRDAFQEERPRGYYQQALDEGIVPMNDVEHYERKAGLR